MNRYNLWICGNCCFFIVLFGENNVKRKKIYKSIDRQSKTNKHISRNQLFFRSRALHWTTLIQEREWFYTSIDPNQLLVTLKSDFRKHSFWLTSQSNLISSKTVGFNVVDSVTTHRNFAFNEKCQYISSTVGFSHKFRFLFL